MVDKNIQLKNIHFFGGGEREGGTFTPQPIRGIQSMSLTHPAPFLQLRFNIVGADHATNAKAVCPKNSSYNQYKLPGKQLKKILHINTLVCRLTGMGCVQ